MSKDTFKNNPDLKEYFETSDGTQFYKEDLAKNHARDLEDKTVKSVSRNEEKDEIKMTAPEIVAMIPEMDLETANSYLDAESLLSKPRKTVVEALETHIESLEK